MPKLFDLAHGNENHTDAPVIGSNTVSAIDASNMNIAREAFMSASDELQAIMATVASSESLIDNIMVQTNLHKSMIANPESVSATTAVLASESMISAAKILGYPMESYQVSRESIEASPFTMLKLTVEAEETFAKKAIRQTIETIKTIIDKIMGMIRKAALYFGTSQKAMEALKAKVEGLDPKAKPKMDKIQKDKQISMVNAYPIIGIHGMDGSEIVKTFQDLSFDTVVKTPLNELIGNVLGDDFKKFISEIKADDKEENIAKQVKEFIGKLNTQVASVLKGSEFTGALKKGYDDVIKARKTDDNEVYGLLVQSFTAAPRILIVEVPVVKADTMRVSDAKAVIGKIKASVVDIDVDRKQIKATDTAYKRDEMLKLTQYGLELSQNSKKFVTELDKFVNEGKKAVKEFGTDDEDELKGIAKLAAARLLQVIYGGVMASVVNDYSRSITAVQYFVNQMLAEYKGGEGNESLEEDDFYKEDAEEGETSKHEASETPEKEWEEHQPGSEEETDKKDEE